MRLPPLIIVALLAGAVLSAARAAAEPAPLPDPPPYVPDNVAPYPGSFSYPYNVVMVGPPWTVDARGVQIGTNGAALESPSGLPGSQLGNSPHPDNSLTSSNARYGISAGTLPTPTVDPGVIIGSGPGISDFGTGLESPGGIPPTAAPGAEASPPTAPAQPPLEDPHGGSGAGH